MDIKTTNFFHFLVSVCLVSLLGFQCAMAQQSPKASKSKASKSKSVQRNGQAQNSKVEPAPAPIKEAGMKDGQLSASSPDYQGIPVKLLFGKENSLTEMSDNLNGLNSYPIVLVPVKNKSGFIPNLHTIYKECTPSLQIDANDRALLVFTEPNLPEAFLVRDFSMLRKMYENGLFQNDTIRFLQFANAESIKNSIFLKKNREVNQLEFCKKLQVAIDLENQQMPIDKPQKLKSLEDMN